MAPDMIHGPRTRLLCLHGSGTSDPYFLRSLPPAPSDTHLVPPGYMYRSSLLVVQPVSTSSAMDTSVDTNTDSGCGRGV